MRKEHYSISFWIRLILITIVISGVTVLLYVNAKMQESLREQTALVNKDMLELYMEQIDDNLNKADLYLSWMMSSNENILNLQLQSDPNVRQLTKLAVRQDLTNARINQQNMEGFFIYQYSEAADEYFFNSVNFTNDYYAKELEQDRIQNKLLSKIEEGSGISKTWFRWKFGDEYYLFRVIYDRNTWLGSWVSLNALIQPLEKINLGNEGFSMLTSSYGQILTDNPTDIVMLDLEEDYREIMPELHGESDQSQQSYSQAGGRQKYLQVSANSARTDLSLVVMIPDRIIMQSYEPIQKVILMLSVFIIILIPLVALLVQYFIYRPLNSMAETMGSVKDGNMDERIHTGSRFNEFYVLENRFNGMMDEINHLKINIYEQQLREKETYLQYLQLQIHPHFFLNCMSLMHNLAELEHYKEIQLLSQNLVRYFRYMFKKATSLIPLQEEINHIRNYMEIQEIRFPRGINCTIEIDEQLKQVLIPPLAIQTFVENSVKYALDLTQKTEISVKVRQLGINLQVTVRDNGKGYPIDVLTIINSEDAVFEHSDTYRIGIRNVKERLKLIFGENAFIHFYNDHGSVSEYVIPLIREGEQDVYRIDG